MKPSLRILLSALFLVLLGAGAWLAWRKDAEPPLPDEKKAAMELLTETQTGPRYFRVTGDAAKPDEQGLVWIDPAAARDQVDGILKERKLNAPAKGKILKLIEEASEPQPSRVVGGERINLARLNLALDTVP